MALLRFLWEQVKWAAAVGAVGAASYVTYRAGYAWWVSSLLLWVGIFIVAAWAIRLLSMLFGGGGGYPYEPQHNDKPKKRETWREREEREWQDMHDAAQREEEDRWS